MSLGWLDKEGKSLGASLGTSGPLPPPLPLNNPALLLSLGGLGILLPGIGHAGLDVHLIADKASITDGSMAFGSASFRRLSTSWGRTRQADPT